MSTASEPLRAALEAATPGPWRQEPDTFAGRVWVSFERHRTLRANDLEPLFNVRNEKGYEQREADAALIVLLRNAAPALCDLLDNIEAVADQMGHEPADQWRGALRAAVGATRDALEGQR